MTCFYIQGNFREIPMYLVITETHEIDTRREQHKLTNTRNKTRESGHLIVGMMDKYHQFESGELCFDCAFIPDSSSEEKMTSP